MEEIGIDDVEEIDTIIAGASEAFGDKDWDETARLLARARFFIESGVREGEFAAVPPRLDLILGLAEYNRGNHETGITRAKAAAEAEPENDACQYFLGWMYHGIGDDGEAAGYFERAAAMNGRFSRQAKEMLDGL